jgi:hypothetical protein
LIVEQSNFEQFTLSQTVVKPKNNQKMILFNHLGCDPHFFETVVKQKNNPKIIILDLFHLGCDRCSRSKSGLEGEDRIPLHSGKR